MSELPLERGTTVVFGLKRALGLPIVILSLEASACWFPLSWKLGMLFAD
jgi:hypothetical protein